MTIIADVHKLSVPDYVDLFIVDLNPIGVGETLYFYPGSHSDGSSIVFQGATYTPWGCKISGIEKRGTGSSARPTAEIANIGGAISALCRTYQDMVGATVTRRRTLEPYITADIAEFRDEYWFIEQRTNEIRETVTFELSSPLDFLDKKLPGVLAIANSCTHQYKSTANGSGCSWPGTDSSKWFDANGIAVGSSVLDVCGKRLTDCKLRFGASNPLDFGGNPGLGRSSQ